MSEHPGDAGDASGSARRYCLECGEIFAETVARCPNCGVAWVYQAPADFTFFVRTLQHLAREVRDGRLSPPQFAPIRNNLERALRLARPPRRSPAPAAPPPPPRPGAVPVSNLPPPAGVSARAAAVPSLVSQPVGSVAATVRREPVAVRPPPPAPRPAAPPKRPSKPVSQVVGQWASHRQADILLYLGAFMLSVAALIFVSFQGGAIPGWSKFAVLLTYTVGFLGLGLFLNRWERVREAGPVFLGLGALLVPIDFISLRTQVLAHDQLPVDVLWLLGAAASGALYTLLAARGYGRYYFAPAVPAWLIAWGALASVLGLPWEWFGTWYLLLASATYAGAARQGTPLARWVRVAALSGGLIALAYAQGAAAWADTQSGQLPVAYLLATAGVAAAAWFHYTVLRLAVLPLLAMGTAMATGWSAFELSREWLGLFIAAAGFGYLAAAYFDRKEYARGWAGLALLGGIALLGDAHGLQLAAGIDREALPAAHGLALLGVAVAFVRWRWRWPEAAAILPASLAATAGSIAWVAFDMQPEWYGLLAAGAGAGYAVHLHFNPARELLWKGLALAGWVLGSAWAQLAAGIPDTASAQLPATYATATAALVLSFVRWRYGWREVAGLLPAGLAATAVSISWAAFDLQPEWWLPFVAATGAAYALHADFDHQFARNWQRIALAAWAGSSAIALAFATDSTTNAYALPVTLGVALLGLGAGFAHWRYTWREVAAALPAAASATALAFAWARFDLDPDWWTAFAAAAGFGYALHAHFDPRFAPNWQLGALTSWVAAVTIAHIFAFQPGIDRDALPLAYGVVLAGLGASFARWRFDWMEAAAALPGAAAITTLTFCWAVFDLQPEWWGAFFAAAGLGYLAWAHANPTRSLRWQTSGLVAFGIGLIAAHAAVLEFDAARAARAALPTAYAVSLAGLVAGFVRWRFDWRQGAFFLPITTSLTGITTGWAAWDLDPEWYPVFSAGSGAWYLVFAHFDRGEYARRWQRIGIAAWAVALLSGHAAVFTRDSANAALPAVYVPIVVALSAGFVRWRFGWREGAALLPAAAVGLGAAFLWAAIEMPLEWIMAWAAGAGLGYGAYAHFDPERRLQWRKGVLAAAALGLVTAQLRAVGGLDEQAVLPVAYGLATLYAAADGLRFRGEGIFAAPILGSLAGLTTLWAFDAGREWWAFPALGMAVAMVLSAPAWPRAGLPAAVAAAFAIALAAAATMISLPVHYGEPRFGLASQAVTATVIAFAAWRANGMLFPIPGGAEQRALGAPERTALLFLAAAFLFAAFGSLNATLGVEDADRAWLFAGAGGLAWIVLTLFGRRDREPLFLALTPMALAAVTLAGTVAVERDGAAAIVFAAGAAGPALAFRATRHWALWSVATVFGALALWSAWEWRGWDLAYLPVAYGAMAAALWAGMLRLRRYEPLRSESASAVMVLSWAPWVLSAAVAGGLLARTETDPGESIVNTREWLMAAIVLASSSAAVVAEGLRLRTRMAWLPGSTGLLLSGLMAVASAEPSNVQAYTAVIGAYLLLLGFTWRKTSPVFGRHMLLHEVLQVAGVLFLVLPPAEQSFDGDAAKLGMELIGLAIVFLALGFVLHARWLVPSGVLTMSGVAVRWLTGGFVEVPFWLILGLVGTALLGVGLLILVQRERWDRWRGDVARWWIDPPPPGDGPLPGDGPA